MINRFWMLLGLLVLIAAGWFIITEPYVLTHRVATETKDVGHRLVQLENLKVGEKGCYNIYWNANRTEAFAFTFEIPNTFCDTEIYRDEAGFHGIVNKYPVSEFTVTGYPHTPDDDWTIPLGD